MNRSLRTVAVGLLAVAGTLGVGVAQARSNVYWSMDIDAPGYPVGVGASFSNAPVVYPQPVYVAPPPVVYAPPPMSMYMQPRPVYYYGPPVYYYGERWRLRHHRHHEHGDDD